LGRDGGTRRPRADPFSNVRLAFHAHGAITRRDFGLTYELAKEAGGLFVGKESQSTSTSKRSDLSELSGRRPQRIRS